MDKFLTQNECDRCKGPLTVRIMSRLNTDCICLACAEKEKEHPLYKEAVEAERQEVLKGNYNYPGLLYGKKL